MNSKLTQNWGASAHRLRFLIIILLAIGVFFRFANLDHKVYWHDEAYTSLRVAGFNTQEIRQEIFQNRIIAPQYLQRFQRIKPGSTINDTIESLAIEDPQHPPFYFLLARIWMQLFGSSIAASRSLSALLSLLLFLLSMPPDLKLLPDNTDAFVFRPSQPLQKALQQKGIQLKLVFPAGQLWQLQRA